MSIQKTTSIDALTLSQPAESSSGVTVDTVGTKIDVSEREQIVIQFRCANHTSGNGVFSVDGSNDGTNWLAGLAMQDLTATASATYVTAKTLNANGSAAVKVPSGWRYLRVSVDVTTDGTYFASMELGG